MKHLWDPFNKQNFKNPYPMYHKLRSIDPIYHAQTSEWIFTKYDDIKTVLHEKRFVVGNRLEWMKKGIHYFKNKNIDFQPIADAMNCFVLLLNPPQHTRVRRLMITAWNDRQVTGIISEYIDQLLHPVKKGSFDLINDYALPLPSMTISRIMGLPLKDFLKLKALSLGILQSMNLYISYKKLVEINRAAKEFIEYLSNYVQFRRPNLKNDLVSKIIKLNAEDHEPLTDQQLISICIFLFVAGGETTVSLVGTGTLNLLTNPQQFEKLNNHMELMPRTVEELLRFDSPVQLIGRIASEDCEFGGKGIKKGDTLTLCLGAANRDPEIFPDPDLLDIERWPNHHLSFGTGIHRCMGDWLAKIQGRLALTALFKNFPGLTLKKVPVRWNSHLAVRQLETLPVNLN